MKKALEGMKILEFCSKVSGAYSTKLLADLGAEVVKIESPAIGDEARKKGPFPGDVPHSDGSGHFLYLNANKLGITLNPETTTGRMIFTKLVKDVDVLVEDSPPGRIEELGLGYEDLKKLNPGLIMTSITPYGLSGPYKDFKAKHLNTVHASGQGNILPMPAKDTSRPPVIIGSNKGGFDAGMNAALAILAAYYWKSISGKGQFIEISRQEGLISMQRVESATFPNDGINVSRHEDKRRAFIGGVVPCRDGHITMLAPLEHQWRSLLVLLGDPEWSKEDFCTDVMKRHRNADRINGYIREWAKDKTKQEIVEKGQALSVPVSAVNTAEDIVNSKQFEARGFFTEIEHPHTGRIKFPTSPYRFSKTPWRMERLAPRLGEHNEEIYHTRLGFTREELVRYRGAGII
ncbi:MAG: CoA transferase [Proteobacteria bacterium]|nr:CoA transferase [Pseudomonadota bacterium]